MPALYTAEEPVGADAPRERAKPRKRLKVTGRQPKAAPICRSGRESASTNWAASPRSSVMSSQR